MDKNYIFDLLMEGYTEDEVQEVMNDLLAQALDQYDEYLREEARKKEEARIKKEELEYKKMRQEEARKDLGAAYVNYLEAYGVEVTESTLERLDDLLSGVLVPGKRYVIRW
jgi:cell division septum initiation protein DivIVA